MIMKYTHPNFKDVHIEVHSWTQYREGFVDLKFRWVHNNGYYLSSKTKLRITAVKWNEFELKEIYDASISSKN